MIRESLAHNCIYSFLSHRSYDLLTLLSPVWNSRRRYRKVFHRKLNLDNPATWSEKLMWLKLACYNKSPLVRQCANKYYVRDYVKDCGLERLLIPCIGLWKRVADVPWETLPQAFVLKSTMGCGNHVFCHDKSQMDVEAACATLRQAINDRYYLAYAEMQYAPRRDMRPEIIGEALVETDDGCMLPDFKLFCFHGEPKYVLYCYARNAEGHAKYMFLDMDWMPHPELHPCDAMDDVPPRPAAFSDMIACARTLSRPFPFVRADFYEHAGKALFGELTFTPSACLDAEVTPLGQTRLGELLDLNCVDLALLGL